ncbi:MAG: metal ABC transporter permease [Candidatus Scalinduaceae bacterium]
MENFLTNLEFFKYSILCSLLVALVCSYLSVYVVLKRIVFVSVAVTQVSSAGIAVAFITGTNPTLISLLFTFLGVAIFSTRFEERRLSNESIIGIGFVVASAATILLVSKSAKGIHEIDDLLFGNVLAVTPYQIYLMAIIVTCIFIAHFLFYKELASITLDFEMARASGMRARLWELMLYLTIGAAISIGIRTAGNLLITSFLTIPAVIGLLIANRMKNVFIIAITAGIISAFTGFLFSYNFDLPTSPCIVAILFIILCLTLPIRFLKRKS